MADYSDVYEIAKKYSNVMRELEYPERPIKPRREDYLNNTEHGKALDKYEVKLLEYRQEINDYSQSEQNVNKLFQKDLLEYLEISNHPKANKLYDMAWEDGHSNGYSEVAMKAEELAELLYE